MMKKWQPHKTGLRVNWLFSYSIFSLSVKQSWFWLGWGLIALLIGILDVPLLTVLSVSAGGLHGDLFLLLRVWGSIWVWLLIVLVMVLLSPGRPSLPSLQLGRWRVQRESAYLLLAPLLSGALAELLKLLIRRERPSDLEFYVFRSWADRPWSTSGLGLPSSHAAVAFGGSLALATLYPPLRWPALAMAVGCGFTRVNAGAHFPSDVLLAALLGLGISALLRRWLKLPQRS
jgi:membrane-associated phospholipid phosphatase